MAVAKPFEATGIHDDYKWPNRCRTTADLREPRVQSLFGVSPSERAYCLREGGQLNMGVGSIKRIPMGWLQRIFGGKSGAMPEPFMEHPTGDFETCLEAMEDAVRRLHELPQWDQWITFTAQGVGDGPESYVFAEVRMLRDCLDVGERPLDVHHIIEAAHTDAASLIADNGCYSSAAASPREVARLLDAIFRHHFGIRSFEHENEGYAVGAEW
jgi:hypothetical protein